VEKVREKSAELVNDLLARSTDPPSLLPSLMPALKATCGVVPVEEPSEEIRLGLVNLTNAAIVASGAMCEPFAEEIAAIVHASMRDQFHDVKKAACSVAGALVSSGASHAALTRHAPKMVNAILPDLQHRHSQVRTACLVAVDALFDLVSCEEVSETLAPGVRTLCSDRTPSVRSAFHVACARWISFVPGVQVRADEKDGDGGVIDDVNGDEVLAMEVDPATLPEGCGLPHARSLLSFLLAGVADPVEANGVKALALVEAVGAANDAALGIDGNDGSTNAPGPSEASATLPPPFTGRPSAAARRLVRSLLPSLTRGALADVREWTSGQRNAGARLLGTILVFAESASSKHLGDLIKEIVAAVGDDDKDTAERVVIAARVLGAHVSPSHWLPIALDHVTAEKGSPASRASALVVLAAMLRVAPAGSLAGEPMAQLAAGLQSEHLRSVMDHPAVRTQLLAALTNAVVGGGTACEPASGHLFRSFLQLRAAEGDRGGRCVC
jgi:dynein assembly factor 5